ncbi:farnesyl pyrophosphate synthase-like isoform X1 [Photinus pyralis]|nr:farnesyl pyrophosphate synthase-like isoform X1 [Photinus pyralis]
MFQATFKRNCSWKSRWQNKNIPTGQVSEEVKTFLAALPKVVDALTTSASCYGSPQFTKRYKELIEFTVLKEHRFRPPILLDAYKALELPQNFSKEKWELVVMFAWSLELTQTAMVVQDDTWEQQESRWNEVCWHKMPNVGLIAINDSNLLYESAFAIVKKYFSGLPEYTSLVELLHYMNLVTSIGQSMDWECRQNGKPIYESFNMDLYREIARRKGGTAIVEGPFMGALALTYNLPLLEYVRDILSELGVAFQIDNDVVDLYDKNGKPKNPIGTDLCEGKPTWMAIKVIETADENMNKVFRENYGRPEPECAQTILKIYDDLKIFDRYLDYRVQTQKDIKKRVSRMPSGLGNAILSTANNVIPRLLDD